MPFQGLGCSVWLPGKLNVSVHVVIGAPRLTIVMPWTVKPVLHCCATVYVTEQAPAALAWLTRATVGMEPSASATTAMMPRRARAPRAPTSGMDPIRAVLQFSFRIVAGAGAGAFLIAVPIADSTAGYESALTADAMRVVIECF